jgi:hypothetical protein
MELSTISVKEFQILVNRKMKFFDRLAFKAGQKKFDKNFKKYFSGKSGFHAGGFALGFFLLLIGVLIAYVINDDYKKNRVKWTWLGFSISIAIWTLVAALASQGVY